MVHLSGTYIYGNVPLVKLCSTQTKWYGNVPKAAVIKLPEQPAQCYCECIVLISTNVNLTSSSVDSGGDVYSYYHWEYSQL